MTDITYRKLMNQYSDTYHCRKNDDGVYVLLNHPAWMVSKGREHAGVKVHVESHSLDGNKLLLTLTDASSAKLTTQANKAIKQGLHLQVSPDDGGGSIVFDAKDLTTIADLFKLKKRQVITEARRERGRELYRQQLDKAD